MGNIGGPEILVVLIVALLVLGPNKLPEAARSMGKAMSEFRRVTGGLQAEMRDAMSQLENEVKGTVNPPEIPSPPAPTPPTALPLTPPTASSAVPPILAARPPAAPPTPPTPASDAENA